MRLVEIFVSGSKILPVAHEGGGVPPPQAPPYTCPAWEANVGTHGGGSFNITSACISLPQARHSGIPRGAVVIFLPLRESSGGGRSSRGGPAPLENTKL